MRQWRGPEIDVSHGQYTADKTDSQSRTKFKVKELTCPVKVNRGVDPRANRRSYMPSYEWYIISIG